MLFRSVPQDEALATHIGKIKKEDAELDLAADSTVNYRKFKAYAEWPRTFFFAERDGKKMRVIVTAARLEGDSFVIERVLPEGK